MLQRRNYITCTLIEDLPKHPTVATAAEKPMHEPCQTNSLRAQHALSLRTHPRDVIPAEAAAAGSPAAGAVPLGPPRPTSAELGYRRGSKG